MKKLLLSSFATAFLLSGCGGGGGGDSSSTSGDSSSTSGSTTSSITLVDTGLYDAFANGYYENTRPSSICGVNACYTLLNDCKPKKSPVDFYLYSNGTMIMSDNSQCKVDKAYIGISIVEDTSFTDALWTNTYQFYSASLKTDFYHQSYVNDTKSRLILTYNGGKNATISTNNSTVDVPINGIYKELDLNVLGITIPQQP